MTNISFCITAVSLLAILLITLFVELYHITRGPSIKWLAAGAVSLIAWDALLIPYSLTANDGLAMFLHMAVFVGISFMPVFHSMFIYSYLNPDKPIKRPYVILLVLIPTITSVLALTNPWHLLMRSVHEMVQSEPLRTVYDEYGIWFFVHTAYSYLMIASGLFMLIRSMIKVAASYRMPIIIMLAGLSIPILLNVLTIMRIIPSTFDTTLIGTTFAHVLMCVAVVTYRTTDHVLVAKDEVFESLSSILLYTDMEGKIISANRAARDTFSDMCREGRLTGENVDGMIARWCDLYKGVFSDMDGYRRLAITLGGKRAYYDVEEHTISDKQGRGISRFMEMRDVTDRQELIDELNSVVNFDALTQLYNRRYFNKMLEELNAPEHLPLCVLQADLNSLKWVNDQLGHAVGDAYIKRTAELIKSCMPENAVTARVGGDEFSALIPHCGADMAETLSEGLKAMCDAVRDDQYGTLSMSIGVGVKSDPAQDIADVQGLADMLMYEDKSKYRQRLSAHADERLNTRVSAMPERV